MKSTKLKFAKGVVLFAALLLMLNIAPAAMPGVQDISVTEAATVKISAKRLRLIKGQRKTLKVTGTKRKVTWAVRNKKVAVVSKKGRVTAKGKGTTTVIAKVGKKKYYCRVTVEAPYLNKKTAILKKGAKTTLRLRGTKQKVKWSTSRKRVAVVSAKGTVVAKGLGKATITAKVGGKKYTCRITVSRKGAPAPKDKITIKEEKIQLMYGETREIKIESNCANLWRRDNNPDSATSKWGSIKKGVFPLLITGAEPGTATITIRNAEKNPTLTRNITVEVVERPESAYTDEEIRAGFAVRLVYGFCKDKKTFQIDDVGYYTQGGKNYVVVDYSAENSYRDRVRRNLTVGIEDKYTASQGYLIKHAKYPKLISVFRHPKPRIAEAAQELDKDLVLRYANKYAIKGMSFYSPADKSSWEESNAKDNELEQN